MQLICDTLSYPVHKSKAEIQNAFSEFTELILKLFLKTCTWKKNRVQTLFYTDKCSVFFIFIASIPSVHMDEQHSVIQPIAQTELKKHRACTAEPLTSTLCFFVHSTAFGPVNKPLCRPQAGMHSADVSEYVSVLAYGFYTGRCMWFLSLFHQVSTAYNKMSCSVSYWTYTMQFTMTSNQTLENKASENEVK